MDTSQRIVATDGVWERARRDSDWTILPERLGHALLGREYDLQKCPRDDEEGYEWNKREIETRAYLCTDDGDTRTYVPAKTL